MEQAYTAIRRGILSGDLVIGAPVSRRQLAAELGMSFVPVKDALQRLESEGLVESRPRVGTRVRIPTARDIREQYVVREALECQAARIFAEKASPDERQELVEIARQLDAMDAALALEDQPAREILLDEHRLHAHFHLRLAECTGCTALISAVSLNQTLVFKWLFDTMTTRWPQPPNWHQILMEAAGGGDPDVAEAGMRRHLRHGLNNILHALSPLSTFTPSSARFADGAHPDHAGWRRA